MEFDYVIVGAGTAGCLLANRLTAAGAARVLLVEAGGRDNYHWIHIPVGYLYCIGNPRTDWMYQTEPSAGLNGRRLRYPRGKVLGGCTSINGMIYMRGQARDFDQWAEVTGEPDWSWENALPDFMAHESHWRMDAGDDPDFARLHNGKGEWRIERQTLRWEILEAYAEAARQAGIPDRADFNDGDNEGVGYFEVNQRRGLRWNAAKAFLRPALSRPNLTLWTRAEVQRLEFTTGDDGGLACSGAVIRRNTGEVATVRAKRSIILAAGAVNSPKLLQLSGIGPAGLLREHGVEVACDLPGVGMNLQDHLQLRTVWKVKGAKTLNTMTRSLFTKAGMALEYAMKRTGPMSSAPSQLGVFTRSRTGLNHANIEYHVQPLSLDSFGEGLHPFPAITASVCDLNPTSRGSVTIASPRPEDAPLIRPNFLSTDADRQVAVDSLRLTRRISRQAALARYEPEEWRPGPNVETFDDLVHAAGDIGTTIFHPVGTTAMGRDGDPAAVLDPHFRLRDGRGGRIRGIRVVDAGAMPILTSGNTAAPTLMMAEKAARWIAAEA